VPAPADFLIEHADAIVTCAGPVPKRGLAQREILPISHAAVAAFEGRIVYVGPAEGLQGHVDVQPDAARIDATGCTVVPGFVDPHTHVVYVGDRRPELRRRLAGATYAQIAAEGGGIRQTVAATRRASVQELVAASRPRLDEMLACGTTTCEAKSGYGLTTESEIAQLKAIHALDAAHDVDIAATFLGAHEIPADYRDNRGGYISLVIDDMIPRVAAERLAVWCDVFCEDGVFTPEESAAILSAGARWGLRSRIHADELGASGGARIAAALRARSADHLVHVGEADAAALAAAGVCAVLLPTAAFYLKLGRFAPARMLIDHGVPVALATDVNPGAGFSPSMPFAMALACFAMHMTLEEALVASTINAAWSLDVQNAVGSLEPGKLMDAVIVNGDLIELVRVGVPAVRTVIKKGRIVAADGRPTY
jgi:imidazolonepropionase